MGLPDVDVSYLTPVLFVLTLVSVMGVDRSGKGVYFTNSGGMPLDLVVVMFTLSLRILNNPSPVLSPTMPCDTSPTRQMAPLDGSSVGRVHI